MRNDLFMSNDAVLNSLEAFRLEMAAGLAARDGGELLEAVARFRAACDQRPANPRARRELALALMRAGELAEAADQCRSLLERAPDDANALATLGAICERQRRPAAALSHLQRASAILPASLRLKAGVARLMVRLGRLDEAQEILSAALAEDPTHAPSLAAKAMLQRRRAHEAAQALLRRGLGERERGYPEAALPFLTEAAELDPGNVSLKCQIGFTLVVLGRFDEAESTYREALAADNRCLEASRGLANVARRRGRTTDVIAFLAAAAAAHPAHVQSRIELSAAYREAGDTAAAWATLEPVLRDEPDNIDGRCELGFIHRARNEHRAALQCFLSVAGTDLERGMVQAALEHRALGSPHSERQALERVLTQIPTSYEALLGLANLDLLGQDAEAALRRCEGLNAAHPARVQPYRLRCRALIQLGRVREAVSLMQDLEAALPRSNELDSARLEVFRNCIDRPAAEALLHTTGEAARGDFALSCERVATFIAFDEIEKASAVLAEAPAATTLQRAYLDYLRGLCAEHRWRVADAIAAYEAAIERRPSFPEAHENLARLNILGARASRATEHLRRHLELTRSGRMMRGLSVALSQNLAGQILNELLLEAGLLVQLQKLSALGESERITPLLEIVRANPDLTPQALCLMLALRGSGALDKPAARASTRIPGRIALFSLEAAASRMSDRLEEWRRLHDGYEHRAFDLRAAAAYVATEAPSEVWEAFQRTNTPEEAGDLFRLAYLQRHGGYFIGAEVRCIAPLGDVVRPGAQFVSFQEPFANLGVSFLACVPGDPVIARALERAVEAVLRGDNDIRWLSTGPGLLTRAFASTLADQGEAWAEWLKQRQILTMGDARKAAAVGAAAPAQGRRRRRRQPRASGSA